MNAISQYVEGKRSGVPGFTLGADGNAAPAGGASNEPGRAELPPRQRPRGRHGDIVQASVV